MNELDMSARHTHESFEVIEIGRDELVAVSGEKRQPRVDHIGRPGCAQQFARGSTEALVEWTHVSTSQHRRQPRLTRAVAPYLSHDPAVGQRDLPGLLQRLESDPHGALVAIKRDQRARVEKKGHAWLVSDTRRLGRR